MKKHWYLWLIGAFTLVIVALAGTLAFWPKPSAKYKKYVYADHEEHINYAYGAQQRHKMDFYLPLANNSVGLILFIHGGGWTAGDKEVYRSSLAEWCQRGYAAMAVNYRYADQTTITNNQIMDDITLALVSAKKLAQEQGVTLTKMLLTGGSAGGHLSLMYAYSKGDVAPVEPAAVVSFCGPTDLADLNFYDKTNPLYDALCKMVSAVAGYEVNAETVEEAMPFLTQASPVHYADASRVVPTVICHGQQDNIVPYSNATELYALLQAIGVRTDLVSFPNSGHGLDQDSDKMQQANNLMLEYAQTYLG